MDNKDITHKLSLDEKVIDEITSGILKTFSKYGVTVHNGVQILNKLIEMIQYTPYTLTPDEIDRWVKNWDWSGYDL